MSILTSMLIRASFTLTLLLLPLILDEIGCARHTVRLNHCQIATNHSISYKSDNLTIPIALHLVET